jgi:muramoyltetrapeptide carboxypeptidase
MILAKKLKYGDKIGIISPSHVAEKEHYIKIFEGIKSIGFNIIESKNLYKDTYCYIASEKERADDFNDMILNDDVKMVFFGGGNGSNEIIPLLDYRLIKKFPKIICSYSDGTSLLNTIYSQTGLIVYYGQTPGIFNELVDYDHNQFIANFVNKKITSFTKNSEWEIINKGISEGILIGGYTLNMALLVGNKYFAFNKDKQYILFLENHEKFNSPASISTHLSHIEQNEIIKNVKGILFGHYSEKEYPELDHCLERFGKRHNIPVIKCDDFGHGNNHGIIPIGQNARIDTNKKTLEYIE